MKKHRRYKRGRLDDLWHEWQTTEKPIMDFPFMSKKCENCGVDFGSHREWDGWEGDGFGDCWGFEEDIFGAEVLKLRGENDIT